MARTMALVSTVAGASYPHPQRAAVGAERGQSTHSEWRINLCHQIDVSGVVAADDPQQQKSVISHAGISCTMAPRILVLSMEFADPLFSGNGVYCRSLVRGWVENYDGVLGANPEILIVCGQPQQQQPQGKLETMAARRYVRLQPPSSESSTARDQKQMQQQLRQKPSQRQNVEYLPVSLPVWRKLDITSSWEAFGLGAKQWVNRVQEFMPDVVVGVDWTSLGPFKTLLDGGAFAKKTPFVYFNFRVFSVQRNASSGGNGGGSAIRDSNKDNDNKKKNKNNNGYANDRDFYRQKERETIAHASVSVALCQADGVALTSLGDGLLQRPVEIVNPPLRDDVRRYALAAQRAAQFEATTPSPVRSYITCCSRLTPEKNVSAFVDIVTHKRVAPLLRAKNITPCLVGSPTDPLYAEAMIKRLKTIFPGESSIVLDFVSAKTLGCDVFGRSVLNIHPALYEAYGMTIVEAAAFGTPSLIHNSGDIGAADLLLDQLDYPNKTGVLVADMQAIEAVADMVVNLLSDRQDTVNVLDGVARRAQELALRWNEMRVATRTLSLLKEMLLLSNKESDL